MGAAIGVGGPNAGGHPAAGADWMSAFGPRTIGSEGGVGGKIGTASEQAAAEIRNGGASLAAALEAAAFALRAVIGRGVVGGIGGAVNSSLSDAPAVD